MQTFVAEMTGMRFAYEGEVAIKISVPPNCAGSEEGNRREGSVKA